MVRYSEYIFKIVLEGYKVETKIWFMLIRYYLQTKFLGNLKESSPPHIDLAWEVPHINY